MAVSTYPSFVGTAKETTYGTPVAATLFTPANTLTPEDVKNYTPDTAMRGSAVDSYGQFPTQGWSTYAYECPVYMDTIGVPLKGILGAEDLSGAGSYTHVFSTLNTGTFQPPSFTVSDYNGFNTRQFPGFMFSQLQFTMDASGLLRASVQGTGLASATTTKPSQTFSAKTAVQGYKGAVTLGGASTTLVENMTLTIARSVNPITAVNNSASPTQIWAGSVTVTGSMTVIYNDDTFLTPMLNGTATAVDVTYTNGADSLNLHCTNGLFTKAPVSRGGNGWMEISVDFTADANTSDANTAGTGYSPIKSTLINTTSAAF
jgi:hypothetical protein